MVWCDLWRRKRVGIKPTLKNTEAVRDYLSIAEEQRLQVEIPEAAFFTKGFYPPVYESRKPQERHSGTHPVPAL